MIEMKDMLSPSSYGLNESLWNFVPLNSIVFFQEGPGLRNWQWTSSGMKVINVKNILWNRTVNTNNSDKYISLIEFEKQYKHFQIDDKDIVMASSGNTYSKIGRINNENLPLMMNTSVIRFKSLNEDLLNNDFLYFFLCSNYMKNQIDCFVTGAAQPNFGPYHLNRMSIPLPSIKIQIKIAEILSAYDDLIENNLKRIKLLEQVVQNIYEEWFVSLHFPGYGDAQINEDTGLPKGWKKKTFSSVVDINPKTTIKKGQIAPFVPMKSIAEHSMVIEPIEEKPVSGGVKFKNGDTLFARITPCLENGKTGFVQFMENDDEIATGSTEYIVLRETINAGKYFIYCTSREREFRGNAIKSMVGSDGRQRVKSECFDKYFINLAPMSIRLMFEKLSDTIFRSIQTLVNQNQKLKAARDILLPRLMNRTIEV